MVAAIAAAAGIVSAGVSAGKAKQAANEQKKKSQLIGEKEAFDKSIFNKQYFQDITRRSEVQNIMRLAGEQQQKADARANAQSAIMGATPEQQLASQEVNRKSYADTIADIASNASMLRDQYLRDYVGERRGTYAQRLGMQDQLANIQQNISNQWAKTADNAFTLSANTAANTEWDKLKKGN